MNDKYRYRITLLRSSGSVWVQDYENAEHIMRDLPELIEEYPHLVVSKQRIVIDNE